MYICICKSLTPHTMSLYMYVAKNAQIVIRHTCYCQARSIVLMKDMVWGSFPCIRKFCRWPIFGFWTEKNLFDVLYTVMMMTLISTTMDADVYIVMFSPRTTCKVWTSFHLYSITMYICNTTMHKIPSMTYTLLHSINSIL